MSSIVGDRQSGSAEKTDATEEESDQEYSSKSHEPPHFRRKIHW
jgi:hypothetical protein